MAAPASLDRALDQAPATALDRALREPTRFLRYASMSKPLEVLLTAAATPRDVAHGLNAIPAGYHLLRSTGAVFDANPSAWTRDVAYLQAPVVPTRCVVVFFTLEEEVTRA